MGSLMGFIEVDRSESKLIPPQDRLKNFDEFHIHLSEANQKKQASRCMDCGMPVCQYGQMINRRMVGCPLHNLIPDYQDALYKGLDDLALKILLSTHPFPEFTSRVCPALCEKACTCSKDGEAVTCHDNEYAIIEYGFKHGKIKPIIPKVRNGKSIAIVGSGPSGLASAQMLNRKGYKVTVYEADDRVGGLLMYGIPNMKLQKEVISRRIDIMEQEGIEFRVNERIVDSSKLNKYDAIVLCAGSTKARGLAIDGKDADGIYYAVDFLREVTKGVLSKDLSKVKELASGKDVIVIGGGDTGNDCTGSSIRLGCRSLTQIEMMPEPPLKRLEDNPWPEWPNVKKTDYGQEEAIYTFGQDPRIYETSIKSIQTDANNHIESITVANVKFIDGKLTFVDGTDKILPCDLLLLAMGFTGISQSFQKTFDIPYDGRVLPADDLHPYKIRDGLYMAGDLRMGQSLVVRAIKDGIDCADAIDKDFI